MIFQQLFRDTKDKKESSVQGEMLGNKQKQSTVKGTSLEVHQEQGRLEGLSLSPNQQKGGMIYGEEGTNENE